MLNRRKGLRRLEASMARGELPKTLVPSTQVAAAKIAAGEVRFKPGDDPHMQKGQGTILPTE